MAWNKLKGMDCLILLLVLCALELGTLKVSRKAVQMKPKEALQTQVVNLRNFSKWFVVDSNDLHGFKGKNTWSRNPSRDTVEQKAWLTQEVLQPPVPGSWERFCAKHHIFSSGHALRQDTEVHVTSDWPNTAASMLIHSLWFFEVPFLKLFLFLCF